MQNLFDASQKDVSDIRSTLCDGPCKGTEIEAHALVLILSL